MRTILFRGITKDDTTRHFFADIWKDNCKGSFVYGSLIIDKGRYYICVSALCTINSCINNGMTSMIEVIPETVGQYTGKTDKNGKNIFEGDIVYCKSRLDNAIMVVIFECGQFRMVLSENYRSYQTNSGFYDINCFDKEVIGNIHDNGELLKGE